MPFVGIDDFVQTTSRGIAHRSSEPRKDKRRISVYVASFCGVIGHVTHASSHVNHVDPYFQGQDQHTRELISAGNT